MNRSLMAEKLTSTHSVVILQKRKRELSWCGPPVAVFCTSRVHMIHTALSRKSQRISETVTLAPVEVAVLLV